MSREQYLKEWEQENQKVLQQIWDKLEFPMNSDQVTSLYFRFPRRFKDWAIDDEIIAKEGQSFVIKPQDGRPLAYSDSYLKELLRELDSITNVFIQLHDGTTHRAVTHLNENTGKVQLNRF